MSTVALHESARQFLHCVNRAVEFIRRQFYANYVIANTTARDALYTELREETGLAANLVQEVIRRAVQGKDTSNSGNRASA